MIVGSPKKQTEIHDIVVRFWTFSKLKKSVVKGMMMLLILWAGYPVSSQTQRYLPSSSETSGWKKSSTPKYTSLKASTIPVRKQSNTHNPTVSARKQRSTSYQRQQIRYSYDVTGLQERPVLAVKTNLLFDAVSAINVGLELPAGESWSFAGEYIFPWWLSEGKQNSFQLISGNLELRRWLGYRADHARMTGWFTGMFAGGGYFDLERNGKGYQGEFFIAPGLSGGYAHEIGRNGKWRMEYALGLGYMSVKYREYKARTGMDGQWHLIRQKSGHYTFIGPVSAKISLVWTLNR
jgi:hypothetical protein